MVGEGIGHRKNDYSDGDMIDALLTAPKVKFCPTINQYGVKDEQRTFEGYGDADSLLKGKLFFDLLEGKQSVGKL